MEQMKQNKMETKPILPLLLSMAFPPMLSMLVQSLYNIVDSMFVARISENALTAVSLAFPIQNLILASALGTGIGVNSYISRKLGERQIEQANDAATHAMVLAFLNYLVFVVLGFFLVKPFFQVFSNTSEIISLGCDYTNIVLLFSFAPMLHIAVEKILQATGNMILPMILQTVGAATNILLDPILIFGLFGMPAMGVKGAAIATIIGQSTAMLLSILVILLGKHEVALHWKGFRFKWTIIKQIYSVGIPSMLMTALGSVLIMGLNSILASFSNLAISLFGVYFKLQTFVYMPVSGLIQGAMPIMGYNYGAANKERLLHALYASLGITFGIMTFGTLVFQLFPQHLLSMFQASDEMLLMGIPALRIISIGFIPATFGFLFATFFQALGKGYGSFVIYLLRQLLITLPLSFFLAPKMGLTGVWISFPIAEIISSFVAFGLIYKLRKKDPVLLQSSSL